MRTGHNISITRDVGVEGDSVLLIRSHCAESIGSDETGAARNKFFGRIECKNVDTDVAATRTAGVADSYDGVTMRQVGCIGDLKCVSEETIVVLVNSDVTDKLGIVALPSIPM